jgi:hypothetical protein
MSTARNVLSGIYCCFNFVNKICKCFGKSGTAPSMKSSIIHTYLRRLVKFMKYMKVIKTFFKTFGHGRRCYETIEIQTQLDLTTGVELHTIMPILNIYVVLLCLFRSGTRTLWLTFHLRLHQSRWHEIQSTCLLHGNQTAKFK